MLSTHRKYLMFDALLSQLETDLRAALGTCITELVSTARARLEGAHSDVAKERAQGLVEVAEERAKALAEVDARRADLGREVAAMHMHQEAQEGRVELNIGGYRFQTSVQTLRRVPHTFFDAYFSGRYAQDVCDDGSIFVDRDGEHFGHILEYMRYGVVAVAEAGARPRVSLLRALKREFGFYCIELSMEGSAEPGLPEMALVMGGLGNNGRKLSSMERYNVASGEWTTMATMDTERSGFMACVLAGEAYVIGGVDGDWNLFSSVEKYSPSSDTWSAGVPLPEPRALCSAVAVSSAIYVLGGLIGENTEPTASVRKLDTTQGTWSRVAPMPGERSECAACVVGTDIFVFGGVDDEGEEQASVFKYDTEADSWIVLAPMPAAEHGHSVNVIDGLIYMTGAGGNGRGFLRFKPIPEVWTTLASTLCGHWHGATFVLGGSLYAAGGPTMERYDAATNTWKEVANMLEYRTCFGAVTIGPIENVEQQDLFDSLIEKAMYEGQ
jgi:hypothetical protein